MGTCFSTEVLDTPRIGINTRIYPQDGPSLQKPIAVAHHLHWDLLKQLAHNGTVHDIITGHCALLGECHDVDWTVMMSEPFSLISSFIHKKGIQPEIVMAPYA